MKLSEGRKQSLSSSWPVSPAAARKIRVFILTCTLAVCAYFLARGTGALFAAKVFASEADARPEKRSEGEAAQAPEGIRLPGSIPPDPRQILKRNIFDSATGPLWPPPAVTDATLELPDPESIETEPPDPDNPPPVCDQNLAVIASVYSNRKPERSFAAIDAPGVDSSFFYREGMTVAEHEVVSVYPWAVYLKEPSGEYCSLRMFTEDNRKKSGNKRKASRRTTKRSRKTVARTNRRSATRSGLSTAEMNAGIHKINESKYRIDRSLVDNLLENKSSLGRIARFVPHRQDGKVTGIKVYSIRRNSLLDRLGLKNGDLVRTVNGFDVTNVDAALKAYVKLRNANRITVALERRRGNRNLNYVIQ
jgi:general secretion pathway protein C